MDEMTINMRWVAVRAWVGIWCVMYVVLRVLLRVLIGRRRRKWIQFVLGLHYSRAFTIRYGQLCGTSYEPAVSRIIHKVLRRREAKIFIDVGAFIGWFSLYAYRILRKRKSVIIIAIEPDSKNYAALLGNTMLCHFVKTMNVACYTKDDEEIEFHLGCRDSSGLSPKGTIRPIYLHPSYYFKKELLQDTIVVKTVRLDTLIRKMGFSIVVLIKMDIQGAEYLVLTDPTLDLSKVKNLIVEVHYRYGTRESNEIVRSLIDKGFKVTALYPNEQENYWYLLAYRGKMPW
jgi:FkbM family methyltransferase